MLQAYKKFHVKVIFCEFDFVVFERKLIGLIAKGDVLEGFFACVQV